jgi:hypothetical protein
MLCMLRLNLRSISANKVWLFIVLNSSKMPITVEPSLTSHKNYRTSPLIPSSVSLPPLVPFRGSPAKIGHVLIRFQPSIWSSSVGGILHTLNFISAGLVVLNSSIQHSKSSRGHVVPPTWCHSGFTPWGIGCTRQMTPQGGDTWVPYTVPAMTCMVGWQLCAGQWQAPQSPNEYRNLYSDVGIDHVYCAWRHGPWRPVILNTVTMLHIPCSPGWLVKNRSGLERGSFKWLFYGWFLVFYFCSNDHYAQRQIRLEEPLGGRTSTSSWSVGPSDACSCLHYLLELRFNLRVPALEWYRTK